MINSVNNSNLPKYKDPLNKDGIVLLSYSNEVGTAIAEIAPKLGTALWAPTFMYLGADIYDKYKNDKDNYNPSGKRAFKRAIYQGVTSLVAMPALIFAAQSTVSPLSKLGKSGISGNSKDAIYKHTKDIIEQAHSNIFDNSEHFQDLILSTLENKINARQNEMKSTNIFKRLYRKFFTSRYNILESNKTKVLKFAKGNAQKTFEIAQALEKNQPTKVPRDVYKEYHKILPIMKEVYNEKNYSFQATRNALKKYQMSKIFNNKLLKTITGLTTLVVVLKPVNDYIEKQMDKYVNPEIDLINNYNFSKLFHSKNFLNTNTTELGKAPSSLQA